MSAAAHRGEVWYADLNPTRGRKQAGDRPVLVLSVDKFNLGPAGMVIVVPVTSKDRGIVSHVRIDPPEGGATVPSFIMCEMVRSVSKGRLRRLCGTVASKTLAEVSFSVSVLLGI